MTAAPACSGAGRGDGGEMVMIDRKTLEALAVSFEERAERACNDVRHTRNGYLTRDSVGLVGESIAFEQAARELRALIADPAAPEPGR
jgi:hypothetical protein